VAWAEPSVVIATIFGRLLPEGYTSEVCTYADDDEPFGFCGALGVCLWVWKLADFGIEAFFDFFLGSVADEDGFSAPFDGDALSYGDFCDVDFCRGEGEYVSGGVHGADEGPKSDSGSDGCGPDGHEGEEVASF
jgi:hypothetical protein